MSNKIFRGIFLVALAVMIVCSAAVTALLYDYYSQVFKDHLKTEADFASAGVLISGESYLQGLAVEDRITLISKDGDVIFDNKADVKTMENHAKREEFITAREEGSAVCERYSDTLSEKTVYFAKMLSDGSVLRVSANVNSIWSTVVMVMFPLAFVILLTLIASAVISNRIAKRIVAPINSVNLDDPSEEDCYEELTPLLKRIKYQNVKIASQIEELKRKQHEFSLISDNMSEGLVIIDDRKEILSANSSILRFFGAAGDVIGKSLFSLCREKCIRDAADSALSGKRYVSTVEFESRIYSLTASPVATASGVNGAVMLVVDITEKEQRERLRREFSANVSHELKTPLASIYGVSDMLKNGLVKPEDVKGFAEDINKEASRLIDLVNDILELSRLDDSAVGLPEEKTSVKEVFEETAANLKDEAEKRSITIDVTGEDFEILTKKRLLEEIVYNLTQNAVKYNKDGGSVVLNAKKDNENCVITVRDTGEGIPPEQLERVFERFYRVDKSRSKKVGGTGLGLSIVKHAAAELNGKAEIFSDGKNGAAAVVTLPLKYENKNA